MSYRTLQRMIDRAEAPYALLPVPMLKNGEWNPRAICVPADSPLVGWILKDFYKKEYRKVYQGN